MHDDSITMADRRAELFRDMIAQVKHVLTVEFDEDADRAEHIGHALADHFADHWGGQNLTIPKDHHYRLCLREMAILDELASGSSYAAITRKYKIGERGLRKLVHRAKARQIDTAQGALPFPD